MKISIVILFCGTLLGGILTGCSSKQAEKENSVPALGPQKPKDALPPNFKFSFFISGNAWNTAPSDSWTIDTSGMVTVTTSVPTGRGSANNLNALATLDPQDMDTLRMLIRKGKLYEIDSADLTQQCGQMELYTLRIVPLAPVRFTSVSFDSCAADYNLLLEPQRKYFRAFIDWWERMRVKYRPAKVE